MEITRNQNGFTLVEAVVGIAIFVLFAFGIYGAMQTAIKSSYQSKLNILETAILREQMEIIRNLPYENVGTLNGVPSGVLPHTSTTERDGAIFDLVYSVRNIDDPIDGTLGGSPNDTAPADYKQVEISIQCRNCTQYVPVSLSTFVSPKNVESSTGNGALFIHVFNSNGLPVSNANVHVVDTSRTPNIVVDDVTDNEGYLRIIDTPTGTQSYNVTISKDGYSSDYTVTSSPENPTPVKPPLTVVSQAITDAYFSIDELGSLSIKTIRPDCSAFGQKNFTISGSKLIGTNPDVYKFYGTFQTDGSGSYFFNSMEWDQSYKVSVSGTGYDLSGSIPMLPLELTPGMNQELSLVLTTHSTSSLLVKVKDAGSGLPLSNARVSLTRIPNYSAVIDTGVGYADQTDWSGGQGQENYGGGSSYFFDDGRVDTDSPAGDIKLRKVGSLYMPDGFLESGTFDLGEQVDFKNVNYLPSSEPPETGTSSVRIQLAFSNTSTPAGWNFAGPDGTSSTFYTSADTVVFTDGNKFRFFRYRVYLKTDDQNYTPQFSDFLITYTNDCVPPGQAFFSDLSPGLYNLKVERSGYVTADDTIDVSANSETTVNLSPNN